ncbi:MAG: MATE family efflux transporter [Lachnospiraceae bacterium]|nr:MATE family efflux transporter [Lachnospiraceae bacterium]
MMRKGNSIVQKNNMIKDHPGKALFFFAVPMILGNLFQQFYTTVDSVIVGRFVGEDALAAVGASYALTTVFIMIAIGGGIGTSVITSQYLGAKNYGRMKTSVYTALMSFLILSVILGTVGLVGNKAILTALNTPSNIMQDAMLYLEIYFIGLPFLFMYNILSATFNALGNSKTPLYLLIFSSLLNIVMDLILVCVFKMGVAGVAIATVFAQGLAAVVSFLILLRQLRTYESSRKRGEQLFDFSLLGNMLKVALPSMLQQSIVSVGMLLVQSVVNGFGSAVLAGYTAGTRIESICIVPMIATGNAVSTFTAQNLGAGKPERVKQGYVAGMKIVAAFAIFICILLTVFHEPIIDIFMERGNDAVAFETGNRYLSFIAFFFVFIGLKAITDGVLRGAGDVLVFTMANLINLTIRVTFAFGMAGVIGVQAVWIAVPIGWATNYLISFIRYLSGKWAHKRLIEETTK